LCLQLPIFDAHKIRKYNSYWNWARQEAFSLFYDTLLDNPSRFDSLYCKRVVSLINRATPELVELVSDIAERAFAEGNARIGRHIQALCEQIREHLNTPPVFRILSSNHDAPTVEVSPEGRVIYKEVSRPGVKLFDEYVKEMRKGFVFTKKSSKKKRNNKIFQKKNNRLVEKKRVPYLSLSIGKSEDPSEYDPFLTNTYYSVLSRMAPEGISFHNKVALVTGCGRGSIGIEVIKGLLSGGASVIITSSRFSKETTDMYRKIYEEYGAKDSELIVFPFNQASLSDINDLIKFIYTELQYDLDIIVPFAALSETGRDVSNLDSLSELSHRVMLTNLLRMIGRVKSIKEEKGKSTFPNILLINFRN
jgi:3-oxoacyl-ACP reductase-like protein